MVVSRFLERMGESSGEVGGLEGRGGYAVMSSGSIEGSGLL